jgi:prophage antirepressor-like protein
MPQAKELDITNACVSAFSFEGADVRVLNRSDEPWWVLADVCDVLSIANPRNVSAKLDEDEKGVQIVDTLGGPQETTIINESGLYSLILTSRKPAAKRFKKWVTAEVLPSIRKTGGYNGLAPQIPRTLSEALRLAADQAEQIEEMKPVVAAYNRLAKAHGSVCLTDAAKMCQMKPQAFIRYLNAEHWIYRRVGSPAWIGYAEHLDNGDLEHKYTTVQRDDGTEKITTQARMTAQGVTKLCLKLGIPAPAFDKQEAFNATA